MRCMLPARAAVRQAHGAAPPVLSLALGRRASPLAQLVSTTSLRASGRALSTHFQPHSLRSYLPTREMVALAWMRSGASRTEPTATHCFFGTFVQGEECPVSDTTLWGDTQIDPADAPGQGKKRPPTSKEPLGKGLEVGPSPTKNPKNLQLDK